MQYLNVPYQWRWSVVHKGVGFFRFRFKKIKIGMDKAYEEKLLVQTEIIKGHFKIVLSLDGKRFIITTGRLHIHVHTAIISMGKKGNVHDPTHTKVLVHRP